VAEPITISWSRLRAHMECRQRAALLRAGHKSPAQNIRNYFGGMVVDKIMRDWLADPARVSGDMVTAIDRYIAECEAAATADGDGVVRWRNPGDRAELAGFCTELLHKLEPILDTLVLPYEFHSALTFRAPITVPYLDGRPTTVILRGEMDLLTHQGPDDWVVWDLKGTKDDQYWRKVLGQLVFYDLAVLATRGVATSRVGLIQPMCRRPVLEFVLTAEHRRQMWAQILRMAEDIWRTHAPPKADTDGCTQCEVRHACVRYAPQGNTISLSTALRAAAAQEVTR